MFQFIVAFIDRSTEREKTAPMTSLNTRHSEIGADVTGDMGQRAWGMDDLGILENRVQKLKKMLVDAFDDTCDSNLHLRKFHLLDHTVEYIRRCGTIFVSDSSHYEHFNVHIKQAYNRTSQRRWTKIIKMVGLLARSYEKPPSYGKKEYDGKSVRSDERLEKIEKSGPHVEREGITVTMNEMAQATNVGVHKSSTAYYV